MYLNNKDKHVIGIISAVILTILRDDISNKDRKLLLAAYSTYLKYNEFLV